MTDFRISIPEFSLVVLVGASGSGKTSLARAHFKPTEIVSSDACRAAVADDENDQSATPRAFELMRHIVALRLAGMRLTVIDATNVGPEDRKVWVELAKEYHCLPVAVVLNLPERLCRDRNRERTDRHIPSAAIERQVSQLRRSLRSLEREGFRHVHILSSFGEVEEVTVEREPLFNNRRWDHGPFDVIGDVHGCFDELVELLESLGYSTKSLDDGSFDVRPPDGRKAVFVGDLVDRGPEIVPVLRLVMSMVASGSALCVPGNHDIKLMRSLQGKKVQVAHGLAESLAQLDAQPLEFRRQVSEFIYGLVSHYVLDDGKLAVAHGGMKEELQGRASRTVRDFALFGETTGETDEFGLPVRYQWALDYRGTALVVYGHTPVQKPEWLNRTINIDTGCVFGGALTALRYPTLELVSVAAHKVYAEPSRPFLANGSGDGLKGSLAPQADLTLQQQADDLLDIEDVAGKRSIDTRLFRGIRISEGNSLAALEVMSRFAADPRWLIYLPPTMSPSETSRQPGLLEHPIEAFAYFRQNGVSKVVCEEKHMGSRAVVIVCRDDEVARRRFGVVTGDGICITRTGRPFFQQGRLQEQLLARLRTGASAAGLWEEFTTDWLCLDCELMPWSAKAQGLLRNQYAAVGAAAGSALADAVEALDRTAARIDIGGLNERFRERAENIAAFRSAYRNYCWPVNSLDDFRLAPFHLLATEGKVHVDRDHTWHMLTLARMSEAGDGLIIATQNRVVELGDPSSEGAGIRWWEELTGRGGEGMVVKPLDFVARGPRGLVQPAIKCRGREYLRIIYGAEYTEPENLARLKSRHLGAKRGLAAREFALGIEALERFVQREPLRRVHECVFGVLALETEPVDPRL